MGKLNKILLIVAGLSALAPFVLNCSSAKDDSGSDAANVTATPAGMVNCDEIAGIPGFLPKDDKLSDLENVGRCAWVLSTGRTTENPKFALKDASGNPIPGGLGGTEHLSSDVERKSGSVVPLPEVLRAESEDARVARWERLGTMNDPGCKAAAAPDKYGLQMDDCQDPFSAGIIGFRKFPNKDFDAQKWDVEQYKKTGKDKDGKIIQAPYLLGVPCGFLHTP